MPPLFQSTGTLFGGDPAAPPAVLFGQSGTLFNPVIAEDNTRYWVGGTGTSNDTAHWSLKSGGVGGATVPTATENARWDANSGGGTCTINPTLNCLNFNMTGFTGTLAGSSTINTRGDFIVGAGITRTWTGQVILSATSVGKVITANGKTLASTISITGVGGGWQHTDDFTTTGGITVTAGAWSDGGKNISCTTLSSSGSGVRSIKLRGTLTITTGWNTGTTTNLTVDVTGGTIVYSGTGSLTMGNINLSGCILSLTTVTTGAGTPAISGSGYTLGTLRRQPASGYCDIGFTGNFTITAECTLEGSNPNAGRLFAASSNPDTPVTITFSPGAVFNHTNVDFQGIVVAGSPTESGSSVGDCLLNTGITFSAPRTLYVVMAATGNHTWSDTANWSLSSGGATGVAMPLGQDTIVIDSSSFGTTGVQIVFTGTSRIRIPDLDFTNGTNGALVAGSSTCVWLGNLNTTNVSGGVAGTFSGHGKTVTFTRGAVTIGAAIVVNTTGTFDLGDTLTSSSTVTFTRGTINQNGHKITCSTIARSGTNTITWQKDDLELTATSGTLFNFNSTAPSPVITDTGETKLSGSSASARTFTAGSLSTALPLNNVWNATTGAGAIVWSTPFQCNEFKSNSARTNSFVGAGTYTMDSLNIVGTTGNNIVFQRSSGIGAYNWVLGDALQVGDFVTISNCAVSPLLTLTNSTDSGGNTGITFI